MLVCTRNSDNRIIIAQSGTDLAVLAQNARNTGLLDGQFTVSVMDDAAFSAALKAQQDNDAAPEKARDDTFRTDPDRVDLLSRLKTATAAQIRTYVTNNVTDLASARLMLTRIILLIALDARS